MSKPRCRAGPRPRSYIPDGNANCALRVVRDESSLPTSKIYTIGRGADLQGEIARPSQILQTYSRCTGSDNGFARVTSVNIRHAASYIMASAAGAVVALWGTGWFSDRLASQRAGLSSAVAESWTAGFMKEHCSFLTVSGTSGRLVVANHSGGIINQGAELDGNFDGFGQRTVRMPGRGQEIELDIVYRAHGAADALQELGNRCAPWSYSATFTKDDIFSEFAQPARSTPPLPKGATFTPDDRRPTK